MTQYVMRRVTTFLWDIRNEEVLLLKKLGLERIEPCDDRSTLLTRRKGGKNKFRNNVGNQVKSTNGLLSAT